MKPAIVADTGPLVALFNAGDAHHAWAKASLGRISDPLFTSEAVLTETLFLLAPTRKSRAAFEEFWLEGGLRVDFDAQAQKEALVRLMRKYTDLPMSLADASVVRMTETHSDAAVWTLDRHFQIYKRMGRQTIPLFNSPWG